MVLSEGGEEVCLDGIIENTQYKTKVLENELVYDCIVVLDLFRNHVPYMI